MLDEHGERVPGSHSGHRRARPCVALSFAMSSAGFVSRRTRVRGHRSATREDAPRKSRRHHTTSTAASTAARCVRSRETRVRRRFRSSPSWPAPWRGTGAPRGARRAPRRSAELVHLAARHARSRTRRGGRTPWPFGKTKAHVFRYVRRRLVLLSFCLLRLRLRRRFLDRVSAPVERLQEVGRHHVRVAVAADAREKNHLLRVTRLQQRLHRLRALAGFGVQLAAQRVIAPALTRAERRRALTRYRRRRRARLPSSRPL